MKFRKNGFIEVLSNNKGFTLLELILVSVAMLVILGMTASFGGKFDSNTDLIASEQALTNIQGNTKGAFKSRGNYTGLANDVADALNIFPEDMVDRSAGVTVRNRYNGTVTLQVNAANNLLQEQIWTNLPMEACMKLALYSPASWLTVDINGTVVDPTAGTAVADANGACNATNNTLTWVSN